MDVMRPLRAFDRFQQRHRRISFVVAVYKKFSDDQGGSLSALMSYYGFVSLFPLLLVFVTVLGFILHNNPKEQEQILSGTLGQLPIISDQIKLHAISGSVFALVIGVVGSLWAGMAVTNATQNAFNRIWAVPHRSRPDFLKARLRSLRLLAALGVLSIGSSVAAGFVGASSHSAIAVMGGVLVALAANLVLFSMLFILLTAAPVGWRELWPGILLAAVLWQILQHFAGFFAAKAVHDSETYAPFAIVLGLLAFLYFAARFTLLAAELNVVRKRRLWPRSLISPPFTDADRRALTADAEALERFADQDVEVRWRQHS